MGWFLALLIPTAFAEYRAFELVIINQTTGQERVVYSTLDPNQYRRYYAVRPDETVTYSVTWKCKGNTGHMKPLCPKPEG